MGRKSEMRALLLKDLYLTIRYHWYMVPISLMMFTIAVIGYGNIFFEVYPLIFAALIPDSLVAEDESCGWIRYAVTMPISREKYVSAKYIYSAMIFSVILTFVFISHSVRFAVGNGSAPGTEILFAAAWLLLAPTVTMSLIFRLGSGRARISYIAAALVIGAIVPIYTDAELMYRLQPSVHIAAMLISLLLFAASWLLSIKFFERREL